MIERDRRLAELDRRQEEADRARENLDAVIRWSDSNAQSSLAFDLREMRARLSTFLDHYDRKILQKRRAVERKIAEEREGAE